MWREECRARLDDCNQLPRLFPGTKASTVATQAVAGLRRVFVSSQLPPLLSALAHLCVHVTYVPKSLKRSTQSMRRSGRSWRKGRGWKPKSGAHFWRKCFGQYPGLFNLIS